DEVLRRLRGRDVPHGLEVEDVLELLQDLRTRGIVRRQEEIRPHAGRDGEQRDGEDVPVPAGEVGEVQGVRHTAVVLDVLRRATDVLRGDDDRPGLDGAPERL